MSVQDCFMGFCDRPGVEMIQAFGNEQPELWCAEHAQIAKANQEAEGE